MQHVVRKDAERSGTAGGVRLPPAQGLQTQLLWVEATAQACFLRVQDCRLDKTMPATRLQTLGCAAEPYLACLSICSPHKDKRCLQLAGQEMPHHVQGAGSASVDEDSMRLDSAADLTYSVSEAIDHIGARSLQPCLDATCSKCLQPPPPPPCLRKLAGGNASATSNVHRATEHVSAMRQAIEREARLGWCWSRSRTLVALHRLWPVSDIPAGVCGPRVGGRRMRDDAPFLRRPGGAPPHAAQRPLTSPIGIVAGCSLWLAKRHAAISTIFSGVPDFHSLIPHELEPAGRTRLPNTACSCQLSCFTADAISVFIAACPILL